jgi:queuine tRNA-ribosyltransferase
MATRWLNEKGVQAVALGGISLGEAPAAIHKTVEFCCKRLPENKPRHLLGVGRPVDLVKGVMAGVDTFDCVAITREARHGRLWTRRGLLRLSRKEFAEDGRVIEAGCDCPTCAAGMSRAYLRAGLRGEAKAKIQIHLMQHNIRFVMRLMEDMRAAIGRGELAKFANGFLSQYPEGSL